MQGTDVVDLDLPDDSLRVIGYWPAIDPTSGDVDNPESWYAVLMQLPYNQRDMAAHK